jgi:hypothetical protein
MTEAQPFNIQEGYQIQIGGILDERWSDWFGGPAVSVEESNDGSRFTTLTGSLDHSALHGILARVRDLNLRLLPVSQTGWPGSQPESRPDFEQGNK